MVKCGVPFEVRTEFLNRYYLEELVMYNYWKYFDLIRLDSNKNTINMSFQ
jgi:hypothetical protein